MWFEVVLQMLLLSPCHFFSSHCRRGHWIRRAHALVVAIGVFVCHIPQLVTAAICIYIVCIGLQDMCHWTYLTLRDTVYFVLKVLLLDILEELERNAAAEYKRLNYLRSYSDTIKEIFLSVVNEVVIYNFSILQQYSLAADHLDRVAQSIFSNRVANSDS